MFRKLILMVFKVIFKQKCKLLSRSSFSIFISFKYEYVWAFKLVVGQKKKKKRNFKMSHISHILDYNLLKLNSQINRQ